jgi:hypothetical protein
MLTPPGAYAALIARTASVTADHTSAASSAVSSSISPTWRRGNTIRCPDVYGYALSSAMQRSPAHTTWRASSSSGDDRIRQNTHPSPPSPRASRSASVAASMYSERHPAHRCSSPLAPLT